MTNANIFIKFIKKWGFRIFLLIISIIGIVLIYLINQPDGIKYKAITENYIKFLYIYNVLQIIFLFIRSIYRRIKKKKQNYLQNIDINTKE